MASNFTVALAAGTKLTCAEAVRRLVRHERRWEVRSAGKGSKGERWYAWAWITTASPRHHLLTRRHLKTGELAFRYCYVPTGQLTAKPRLIRAAGLRWPVEEDFEFGEDCFGLDQCQARRRSGHETTRSTRTSADTTDAGTSASICACSSSGCLDSPSPAALLRPTR